MGMMKTFRSAEYILGEQDKKWLVISQHREKMLFTK